MAVRSHRNTSGGSGSSLSPQRAFTDVTAPRTQRIVEALAPSGSSVVLTGEPGSGKAFLAQSVAYAFQTQTNSKVHQTVVGDFSELFSECRITAGDDTRSTAACILEGLAQQANGAEIIIIGLNIDRYTADEAAVFEMIVRARRVRCICTAQRVVGAADRLARDPVVRQFAVQPLSIEETGAILAKQFGAASVPSRQVARWHAATRGNHRALITLALAAERRGAVQRAKSIAWVSVRDEEAPADFIEQLGELTPLERHAIEFVSYAAPLHEPSLLKLLDAEAVDSLLERQILVVKTDERGMTALCTRIPIVAESFNRHLLPSKRAALATACFDALAEIDFTPTAADQLRQVRFGLDAGAEVAVDSIWQALRATARSGDLPYILNLAMRALRHENPVRAADALLRATDLGYFLQQSMALNEAMSELYRFINDPARFGAVPFPMQFALVASSICLGPEYSGRPQLALAAFDRWRERWLNEGIETDSHLRPCLMRVQSLNGLLNAALATVITRTTPNDLEAEWLTAPAQTYEALLRVQRGEFSRALALAERTRQLIFLHDVSPTISGDIEGFAIFLAHWARGTSLAASETITEITETVRADIAAVQSHSGLIDLALALLALQEGRWLDAAEHCDTLVLLLTGSDPLGTLQLAYSAKALALAALGENTEAYAALRKSALDTPGISQTLRGFGGVLNLRARHWLRDPELVVHAQALVEWAQEENLALIELEALDILAYESAAPPPRVLERAAELAATIDPPIGEAILAHIRAITREQGPADADPEERLLSELGVWLPLPPGLRLTGREREIALFTALGYSSRYVAEHLHLSARTVETHLGHVYSKLGLEDREALRLWFRRRRATGRSHTA